MIIIKIKTWKDWKKDFYDWVLAPRRRTCVEFVDYMETLQEQVLRDIIADTCIKYDIRGSQIKDITEAVEKCVAACAKETRKLINECKPAKFF